MALWGHPRWGRGVLGPGRMDPGRDVPIGLVAVSAHGMGGHLGEGGKGQVSALSSSLSPSIWLQRKRRRKSRDACRCGQGLSLPWQVLGGQFRLRSPPLFYSLLWVCNKMTFSGWGLCCVPPALPWLQAPGPLCSALTDPPRVPSVTPPARNTPPKGYEPSP